MKSSHLIIVYSNYLYETCYYATLASLLKKTKSLRLGISEDENVTLGSEKIDQVGSFAYLGSIISKDGGISEDVKSRIAKAQGVFHS